MERIYKLAAVVIQMGEPETAGRGLADIVIFLLGRIKEDKRKEAINSLRTKIWNLNEHEISSKKTPASASLGQSITFIKTVLNGHNPAYIRQILTYIVKNLY
jgi:hypothetical protein